MRRRRRWALLILLLVFSALVAMAAEQMFIQCQTAILRPTPNLFSTKSLGELREGDPVTVVKKTKGWMQVTSPKNKTGWIHVSALTKKKYKAKGDAKEAVSGFSEDEVAGSADAFTEDAEKGFKQKNPNISFDVVDKMEKTKVSTQEIVDFLKEGQVEAPKGGAE